MVTAIEEDAAAARRRTRAKLLGREAILAQHPHTRPERIKRSPAPFVHAACKAARLYLYKLYAEFVEAYRAAVEAPRLAWPSGLGSAALIPSPFPSGRLPNLALFRRAVKRVFYGPARGRAG
jgi:hypothetical protein